MKLRTAVLAVLTMAIASCDRIPGTREHEARRALELYLFDPWSAKITVFPAQTAALCGTVNAKNRMGAYVGARLFMVAPSSTKAVVFSDSPTISTYRTWQNSPQSSDGQDAYNQMEDGCDFKINWAKSCDPLFAETIVIDEDFCSAWKAKDWKKLSYLGRY